MLYGVLYEAPFDVGTSCVAMQCKNGIPLLPISNATLPQEGHDLTFASAQALDFGDGDSSCCVARTLHVVRSALYATPLRRFATGLLRLAARCSGHCCVALARHGPGMALSQHGTVPAWHWPGMASVSQPGCARAPDASPGADVAV